MPPEKRGAIPKQNLKLLSDGFPRKADSKDGLRSSPVRRLLLIAFVLALSGYAVNEMYHVFLISSLSSLEWAVLLLFSINFTWIALAFAYTFVGFFIQLKGRSETGGSVELKCRCAIVVPIYNESPDRVFALVESMALELTGTPGAQAFDWFVLSDSTDPRRILAEEQAFWHLRQATFGKANVYYRRRVKNVEHKAGNIEDFCRRWGLAYDFFVVLDADSVMEPHTILKLAERMQQDPDAGIIQTIPVLINGKTPFALVQQFASKLYGPLLGGGLAWWTQKEGNYWGHNAIIRMEAFMKAAGLPLLAGPPPLGGPILSHDFVEAALIRRAGWSIVLAHDLGGSYEQCPPSIYDMAVRDRRWCQGNLQHSKVINARGLHWVSRFHLITGILSYLCSPLWLMLIISGLLLSLQAHYFRPEYFTTKFTLFPVWPVMDFKRALQLFVFTMGVLFGPKIFGLGLQVFKRKSCKAWGGRLRLILSFLTEVLLSALIAPLMMLLQTSSVISILFFRKSSSWKPQRRGDGSLSIKELFRFHGWHMVWGFFLGYAASLYSWTLFAWMSPALAGLWAAIPLSLMTASEKAGKCFRNFSILSTPEEVNVPNILRDVERRQKEYSASLEKAWDIRLLLKHPELMALHLEMIDKKLAHQAGTPIDSLDAIAMVKVNEAESQEALLQLLTSEELSYVLGQPNLLQKMADLPSFSPAPG